MDTSTILAVYIPIGIIVAMFANVFFFMLAAIDTAGRLKAEGFWPSVLLGAIVGFVWPVTISVVILTVPSLLLYIKLTGDKSFIRFLTYVFDNKKEDNK